MAWSRGTSGFDWDKNPAVDVQQDATKRYSPAADRRRYEQDPLDRARGALPDDWLGRIIRHKPPMVAVIALANKMVRIILATMTGKQNLRMA